MSQGNEKMEKYKNERHQFMIKVNTQIEIVSGFRDDF